MQPTSSDPALTAKQPEFDISDCSSNVSSWANVSLAPVEPTFVPTSPSATPEAWSVMGSDVASWQNVGAPGQTQVEHASAQPDNWQPASGSPGATASMMHVAPPSDESWNPWANDHGWFGQADEPSDGVSTVPQQAHAGVAPPLVPAPHAVVSTFQPPASAEPLPMRHAAVPPSVMTPVAAGSNVSFLDMVEPDECDYPAFPVALPPIVGAQAFSAPPAVGAPSSPAFVAPPAAPISAPPSTRHPVDLPPASPRPMPLAHPDPVLASAPSVPSVPYAALSEPGSAAGHSAPLNGRGGQSAGSAPYVAVPPVGYEMAGATGGATPSKKAKVSKLAVASVVLSLAGVAFVALVATSTVALPFTDLQIGRRRGFGITALFALSSLGLRLGMMGHRKITKSKGRLSGHPIAKSGIGVGMLGWAAALALVFGSIAAQSKVGDAKGKVALPLLGEVELPVVLGDPNVGPPPSSADFGVVAGECVATMPGDTVAGPLAKVDCGAPHAGEVFLSGSVGTRYDPPDPLGGYELPPILETEPDRQAWVLWQCSTRFASYTGTTLESSTLDFMYFMPSQDGWAAGDRAFVCILFDPANATMQGSRAVPGAVVAPVATPVQPEPA